jgi:DNA-binding CsgD family transcriptional regulator
MLVGREADCDRVDRVLESARSGRSAVLLVHGEAGVGKTSLLRYAIERAEAMTVARATGVEYEAELEFSGLLELCRPLLHHLDELPQLQAKALRGVLRWEETDVRDRFAIGAATLSLLAAAAEQEPLLLAVDDAHWLDRPSADALRFAARRLLADPVAVVVATRLGEGAAFELPGADELVLAPLDLEATRALLERTVGSAVSDTVVDVAYTATNGNPLALLELPGALTPEQLAGREPLVEPLPVGAAVERAFAGRVERLAEPTRTALLVLALATVDRIDAVARALSYLGLEAASLEPAEDARLIEIDEGRVRFRHPLVRSVLTHAASGPDRRAAHRALAEASTAVADAESRAWHLAGAALGPDEEAAAVLAEAGTRARERSGFGPASAALERAARLTPDESLRLERLADAADCAWRAGSTERAVVLLDESLGGSTEPRRRARLLHRRGRLEVLTGSQDTAHAMLLEAGRLAEGEDPVLAAVLLGDAVEPCWFRGRVEDGLEVAKQAREHAPRDGTFVDAHVEYWLGTALAFAGRPSEAARCYERLLGLLRSVPDASRLWALTVESNVLAMLDRSAEGYTVGTEAVRRARQDGPTSLASTLALVSRSGVRAGYWQWAVAAAMEGLTLARELGQTMYVVEPLCDLTRIEAARGEADACRTHAAEVIGLAERHGLAVVREQVRTSLGLLELGLGHPEEALRHLDEAAGSLTALGYHDRDIAPEADRVEALVRLGRIADAQRALPGSIERAGRTGPAWGAAVAARLRALLADEEAFEASFETALELHQGLDDAFSRARTQLAFGERLRRAGRRRDARVQLRAALETFDELGAVPWRERASGELRASGQTLRKRQPHEAEQLTPQELQVAQLVAEGKTNKEAGAALFLSHKTVEFHLGQVYRKLGVGSRVELARQFAAGDAVPAGRF